METQSTFTLVGWQARQIEKAARIMTHFVESTREDRLRWQPSVGEESKTRSVMEMVGECTFANRRFIAYLNGLPSPPVPASFESGSAAEATKALEESAMVLGAEIRKLQYSDLSREIETHRGKMAIALAIQFPLRNMTYHIGQINLIQLLYGDTEFHINDDFVTL